MCKKYIEMLKREFSGYNLKRLSMDATAGLTVCAVALPLALAFGVSSGADAAAGLITSIIAGFVISLLSGAGYQTSGASGPMCAVLIVVVSRFGMKGVFISCLMAGVILILCGILKLGKLVSIIPMPVVTGFTSGVAVIIASGQIDNFFGTHSQGVSTIDKISSYFTLGFNINLKCLAIALLVVAIMSFWPKKWARIPSSLVSIILATIVCVVFKLNVPAVGTIPKTILHETRLAFGDLSFSAIFTYGPTALSIAALAMIESLLCGASASKIKNEQFDPNIELVAQGIGNVLIPFFGGVPATAAIARSSMAIKSGSQTRLTGIFHALFLLCAMFLFSGVMALLPLSALAGVLVVTAFRMNDWETVKYIFKNRFKGAIMQYVITLLATVVFGLTTAIMLGIVFSALVFVANNIKVDISVSEVSNDKLKHSDIDVESVHKDTYVVYITGNLFFGNAGALTQALKDYNECSCLIFSLRGLAQIDTGCGKEFIDLITEYKQNGCEIILCGMSAGVENMLIRSGLLNLLDEKNLFFSVDKALTQSNR